jgi:hypothetical protein
MTHLIYCLCAVPYFDLFDYLILIFVKNHSKLHIILFKFVNHQFLLLTDYFK